ncbi:MULTISPECIES: M18 family aminopeptidase [Lachnospiraceae]|uniref:M18 family aminopeptidase n=1 Tax=Faecalicatena acetigenes TaxID=2981790 RepID=A0ABT2TE98_9FIRM|nr:MULTISPECIES: M18 family aminopeptidase [Lachnospiraceae]MCU6748137.1 M18 family aminopeptidase [Faecalicatena acetigenes]RGT73761.1 M18 family aminopeptidase [Ruminococcus sp. AF18-22]SCI27718.1 Probable M18 family aminopeptidase 2 [uncultured Clostridium sp.]
MYQKTAEELLKFLSKSPTSFHAVFTMKEMLFQEGYQELKETQKWDLKKGGRYLVTRNESSLIAFSIPEREIDGYRIMTSHSDSPSFKIKENPEILTEDRYVKLNVERYGGMLCAPWFDRPLSVAGRVVVKKNGVFLSRLVNIDRDLVLIPNLAIHMDRTANDGYKYNIQKDLLPLYGTVTAKGTFFQQIADAAGVTPAEILGHDLFLYNRQEGTIWGADNEFISAGRLDDLQCAFASLKGFLQGKKENSLAVHCVLDNEEVGSQTKQGAASTFLYDTLTRINSSLGFTREDYLIQLAKSFMISADNAHAVHPNHMDKADPTNRPYLNEGIVIKYNANQKYCTDGISSAMFKDICREADVPVQTFVNRSDMAGGSTLGNISNTQVALNTVDIGLPQLAMHSPYETSGIKDTAYLIKAAAVFFH